MDIFKIIDAMSKEERKAFYKKLSSEEYLYAYWDEDKAERRAAGAKQAAKTRVYNKKFGVLYGVVYTPEVLGKFQWSVETGVDEFAEVRREQDEEERKQEENEKTWRAYREEFGPGNWMGDDDDDDEKMRLSLATGDDQLADAKRKYAEMQAKRQREHEEFLTTPIDAKTEKKYTRLIKRFRLYGGACNLSWKMYFQFREEHADTVEPLTDKELAYAAQWTSYAVKEPAT
jgi:hypothetical protein